VGVLRIAVGRPDQNERLVNALKGRLATSVEKTELDWRPPPGEICQHQLPILAAGTDTARRRPLSSQTPV